MAYLDNIPIATDVPAVSQPQIVQNFSQLNTQFGVEHVALTSPLNQGKHKYVTLQRSLGIPPVGTDISLAQAVTALGNPYLQCNDSAWVRSVPTIVTVTGNINPGTNVIFDFAAAPGMPPQMGHVHVMDSNTGGKSIFTFFVWMGGSLHIAGTSAQLISGSVWTKVDAIGTTLTLANTGALAPFMLKITGSAL